VSKAGQNAGATDVLTYARFGLFMITRKLRALPAQYPSLTREGKLVDFVQRARQRKKLTDYLQSQRRR
jgi:hypothetical protein